MPHRDYRGNEENVSTSFKFDTDDHPAIFDLEHWRRSQIKRMSFLLPSWIIVPIHLDSSPCPHILCLVFPGCNDQVSPPFLCVATKSPDNRAPSRTSTTARCCSCTRTLRSEAPTASRSTSQALQASPDAASSARAIAAVEVLSAVDSCTSIATASPLLAFDVEEAAPTSSAARETDCRHSRLHPRESRRRSTSLYIRAICGRTDR